MTGIISKSTGGLYTVINENGSFECRARGVFRHKKSSPLVGDRCEFSADEKLGFVIESIGERKNELIRPAVSNIDTLFVSFAAASPDPDTLYIDKLISTAVHNSISVVIIITKTDLAPQKAAELEEVYKTVGIPVFLSSSENGEGIEQIKQYIREHKNETFSFAGPSGVGKSTMLNTLFPELSLRTGSLSEKIERGKHTTREVTLYPLSLFIEGAEGYIADTPGFTSIDFINFNFFTLEELPDTFPEFADIKDKCYWRDCTHTKENDCAVRNGVKNGTVAKSRYESYLSMYEELKNKKQW